MKDKQAQRDAEIAEYESKNLPNMTVLQRFLANARWGMFGYLAIIHIAAVMGAVRVASCTWRTLALSCALYYVTALGITAGVHRLYSHKSYTATLPYRILIMIFASMANQGTIFHWARDHRVHHLKCETDADPHNAERGFFFSHVGWLLVRKNPRVKHAGQDLDLSDLKAMPEVAFQKRVDPYWNLAWCFVVPALLSQTLCGDTFVNGLLVAGALRYAVVLHITWLVNSAAHVWGFRPYEHAESRLGQAWPSENPLVSLGAIGEGWHNWHHAYPFDYAASELGVSEQFNPTKLFIDCAAGLGFVRGRKRATRQWVARKERLAKTAVERNSQKTTAAEKAEAASVAPASAGVVGRRSLKESLTGVPLFRVRRVQLTSGCDSYKLARMPS